MIKIKYKNKIKNIKIKKIKNKKIKKKYEGTSNGRIERNTIRHHIVLPPLDMGGRSKLQSEPDERENDSTLQRKQN